MAGNKEKKPFFLKRWSDQLFGWLDNTLFKLELEENKGDSLAVPVWLTFLIGIGCGLVYAAIQAFGGKNGEKIAAIVGSIIAVGALGVIVYFIIRNWSVMKETGGKIARSAAFLVVGALTFVLGLFIGVWGFIIVMVVVVGWIVLKVWLGDSSSSKKEFRLDDGTIVRMKRDLTGTPYYEGNDGYNYERNSDGTFTRC